MKFHKVAFLFPGQGAQFVGMGRDFYEQSAEAREVFEEAESLLSSKLTQTIFEGPEALLTETKNSQVALFVTSLAIVATLKKQFPDLKAFATSGLSLGEYTALSHSGRLPFSEACPLVQYRAACMNEACLSTSGTMAAILGLSGVQVEEVVKECSLPNELWIANYNAPLQTVVSGTASGIEAAEKMAMAKGAKRFIRLNVHGAFHSGLMKEAEGKLREPLSRLELKAGSAELVMNVPGDFVKEEDKIRQFLISQVTSSVRWAQGVKAMESAGVDLYVEIGAGKVLSGFNRQIGILAPSIAIGAMKDLDNLAKTIY